MKNKFLDDYLKIKVKGIIIPVQVKRFPTSKRLRLYGSGNNIRITAPSSLDKNRILEILNPHFDQIYKLYIKGLAEEDSLQEKKLNLDIKVYIEGILTPIHYLSKEKFKQESFFSKGVIYLYLNPEERNYDNVYKQIDSLYTNLANIYIARSLDDMLEYFSFKEKPNLIIKKMKRQWGNCKKSENRVVLNYHLMKVPPILREYVAFHELTHLIHANHGKEFYKIMDNAFPKRAWIDKELKKWSFVLRDNYVEEYHK